MTGSVEKVYSDALFELAAEQGMSDEVYEELNTIAQIFRDNPEFAKMLNAPTVSTDEKADVIANVFKGKTSELTYNLMCVLTDKRRITYLPAIADSYKERWYDMKNIVEVKVTTSVPLNETLKAKLKLKLEAVYKKSIILEEAVDESIIGGIVINYGNTMLDGTVKSKLESMQKQIKNFIA